MRRATVTALAGSPHPEAAAFLLGVVEKHADDRGVSALIALGSSRFRNDMRERAAAGVARTGNELLQRAFDRIFAAP